MERVPFLCQCDEPSCREPIRLAPEEYERVRSDSTSCIVVTGHSTSGAIAAETDPREEGA